MPYTPPRGGDTDLALARPYTPPSASGLLIELGERPGVGSAYAPPAGDAVDLALAGAYTPPDAGAVALHLSNEWWYRQVRYRPPYGDAVALAFSGSYTPPSGLDVALALGQAASGDAGPEPPPEPVFRGGDFAVPWQRAQGLDRAMGLRNVDSGIADTGRSSGWDRHRRSEAARSSGWRDLPCAARASSAPWGRPARRPGRTDQAPFVDLPARQRASTVPWAQGMPPRGRSLGAGHRTPPPRERSVQAPTDTFATQPSPWWWALWDYPPSREPTDVIRWGRRPPQRVCSRHYRPPPAGEAHIDLAEPSPGWQRGESVTLAFSLASQPLICVEVPPNGPVYSPPPPPEPVEPPPGPIIVPDRERYLLMPTIEAQRVSDGLTVWLNRASIRTDRDSWAWQCDAVPARAEDLTAVMPGAGGPVELEVTINGWSWVFIVESYRRQRAWNSSSYQISGRSRSAYLAAPYSPTATGTETSQQTAQQLALAQLETTGWTLDWQTEDWIVPGGVWSYQELTPMQAITRIAGAVGAVVQVDRAAQTLRVVPRYPISPWDWAGATPDLVLPESAVAQLSMRWEPAAWHNAIYVAGKAQGVLVHATRSGTAADREAPMVVDPLIVERLAGRERGRQELATSGDRGAVSITTPMLPDPEPPGLIEPGTLVEVQEAGETWRGQVMATSVEASRQNATTVRQTIEVERYYGD